jgi:Bacterial extracellular solute-binding protein, family 7
MSGAKPFMAGNTGVCMGGWFRRELNSGDDLKGLKIRSLGLGGEIYRRLGATPQTTSPGEILTSMQSGRATWSATSPGRARLRAGFSNLIRPFVTAPRRGRASPSRQCWRLGKVRSLGYRDAASSLRYAGPPASEQPELRGTGAFLIFD